ncbi:MAG: hypothetical protein U0R44_01850 [Candidatus Micrarchaeia archaeon]
MTAAIMQRASVIVDSTVRSERVSLVILARSTMAMSMAELVPPTTEPRRTPCNRGYPSSRKLKPVTRRTQMAKTRKVNNVLRGIALATEKISIINPASKRSTIRARVARKGSRETRQNPEKRLQREEERDPKQCRKASG